MKYGFLIRIFAVLNFNKAGPLGGCGFAVLLLLDYLNASMISLVVVFLDLM
jgi:hypothetical protein